jgi:predicted ATP-grasp superfamily ATP-dependent carboligase
MLASMIDNDLLTIHASRRLEKATLVLAFTGWMDGGDVSTGTVRHLVELLHARPIAEIDAEPFYIYNVPGPMQVAELFRPPATIEDGLVKDFELPTNTFYCHAPANLLLFIGKEPHMRWRTFGECIFQLARQTGVERIVFVGSFGGAVPHTRLPRLYVTCSHPRLLPEMEQYAVRRTGYQGPSSFTTYLMTRAQAVGVDMISLVAEIPGYLQGANPASIEAVTRRLSKLLNLHLDLASLRGASTMWELEVSKIVEQNEELAATIRKLEEEYDNELLRAASGE